MPVLNPGDVFPRLTVTPPGGEPLVVPDAFAGSYSVVLFLRGAWCPYCNGQLHAFHRAEQSLAEAGVKVAALWVDDEPTTAGIVEKYRLGFPLGHSVDAHAIASLTGAFVNPDPVYLQSTGFVLSPEGTVVVSVYSSGAIGRLLPEDVIGFVRHLSEQPAA